MRTAAPATARLALHRRHPIAARAAAMADAASIYPHGLTSLSPADSPNSGARLLGRYSDVAFGDLPDGRSAFVRPSSVFFTLDGATRKRWDVVASHASVGIVLYHAEKRAAVLVRQFRPPVYRVAAAAAAAAGEAPPPLSAGLTYELCAGILDKSKTLEQTASEEIEEECGFRVPPDRLQRVVGYATSIGTQGAPHTVFFAAVTDADRIDGGGGGVDGEAIETLALPVASIDAFLADDGLTRSAGLCFGLLWLERMLERTGGGK
jgi:nudix-type nucleoside diphosphatase (YffH/AdpP family)